MLQSAQRVITQNTSDTEFKEKEKKKKHQALAVKEKHYETKWWEYSGGKIPTLDSATAGKNCRAKPCQILRSWMGWAKGNTENLFVYLLYSPYSELS